MARLDLRLLGGFSARLVGRACKNQSASKSLTRFVYSR